MKDIKVVIGTNFGDEGKGLLTDYLASSMENAIVVRFNGGAQAGHTVTTPAGQRHVFGHIGSGSFVGLPSYLSSFFVVNPMLFIKEMTVSKAFNITPKIYIDRDCLVTTPYDMLINQIAEIMRGSANHGSCGIGFNETISRSLFEDRFRLSVKDLMREDLLRKKLDEIKTEYMPIRLEQLKIDVVPERYLNLFADVRIIDSYIADVSAMLDIIEIADINTISSFDSILFEGAQGLLLDQSHAYFPHVTRSNTGMKNVSELIKQAGLSHKPVEIIFVTRAYLTRHGAGPFPSELQEKPYSKIVDLTNIPNPYQGTLRFGLLDLDALSKTIHQDLKNAEDLKVKVKLAVTCLDQLDTEVDYIINSNKIRSTIEIFINKAFAAVNIKEGYTSYGPTRNTIQSKTFE